MDREGKTPLIVACMNPERYNVAKTLIELGANVNAYRPGMALFLVVQGVEVSLNCLFGGYAGYYEWNQMSICTKGFVV